METTAEVILDQFYHALKVIDGHRSSKIMQIAACLIGNDPKTTTPSQIGILYVKTLKDLGPGAQCLIYSYAFESDSQEFFY